MALRKSGYPDDLKLSGGNLGIDPQRLVGSGGGCDLFVHVGEAIASSSGAGALRITRFDLNDGNAIDPANPPSTVTALVEIQNPNQVYTLLVSQVNVAPPNGFSMSGMGPVFPITIIPGGTQTLVFEFDVDAANLKPGVNVFEVSASGQQNSTSIFGTETTALSIVGVDGSLVGLDMNVSMNPTVLQSGRLNTVSIQVTVANGGQETLRDIELHGRLLNDFSPNNLQFLSFSPDPSQVTIVPGLSQTFRANVTLGALTPSRVNYTPAITMFATQSDSSSTVNIRTGSVTKAVANPVQISDPPANSNLPNNLLVNSDSPSSCGVQNSQNINFLMLLLLSCVGIVVMRRRYS